MSFESLDTHAQSTSFNAEVIKEVYLVFFQNIYDISHLLLLQTGYLTSGWIISHCPGISLHICLTAAFAPGECEQDFYLRFNLQEYNILEYLNQICY